MQLIDLIPRAGTWPLALVPLLESDVFALWEENILTGRVRPPPGRENFTSVFSDWSDTSRSQDAFPGLSTIL